MANRRKDRDYLMRQAAKDSVGFRMHGAQTRRHIWLSEHEKRPLTRDEKDSLHYLIQQGYLRPVHAVGNFGRGVYETTQRRYTFTTEEPKEKRPDTR